MKPSIELLRLAKELLAGDSGTIRFNAGMVGLKFHPDAADLQDPKKTGILRFEKMARLMENTWNKMMPEDKLAIGTPEVTSITEDGDILTEVRTNISFGMKGGFPPNTEDKAVIAAYMRLLDVLMQNGYKTAYF